MSLSVNDLYNSLGSTSTLSTAALKSTASADQLTSQIKDAGTDDEMMSACQISQISVPALEKCLISFRAHSVIVPADRRRPGIPDFRASDFFCFSA